MREQGMTREQRLELLKQIEKDICVCSIESTFLDDAKSCAIHSSIEELEQEPVLDKIRAEIEQEITYKPIDMWDYRMGLTKALEIIEKNKTESEG